MSREYSPIRRCVDCGTVTSMMVIEQGLDDNGERYRAIFTDHVPHGHSDCVKMQALAREEWPTLF